MSDTSDIGITSIISISQLEVCQMSWGPGEVFEELAFCLGAGYWNEAAALYAADVVVTNPFSAESPAPETGRESVVRFFASLAAQVSSLSVDDIVVHHTTDAEVVVAEFRCVGRGHDGSAFEMPAVFVLRVRGGLIIESRDYLGPRRPLSEGEESLKTEHPTHE